MINVLLANGNGFQGNGLVTRLNAEPDIRVIGEIGLDRRGIEEFTQSSPDVVVIRSVGSVVSGIESTLRLRTILPSIKVVITSPITSPGHLMLALEAGVQGYVAGNAGQQALIGAIRAVAAGANYLSKDAADMLVADYFHRQRNLQMKDPFKRLSKREWEVLKMLVEGESASNIAEILALSPKTVDTYRRRLMRKLGVTNVPALVKLALQHGLTSVT